MSTQFKARRYLENDEYQITDLLATIWGGWPRFDIDCEPVDHWRWKYLDNPLGKNKVTVAVKEDQIVGCHHVVYFPAKIGANKYLISQAMDLGTHPDFRRMGVNSTISKYNTKFLEEDDSKFTYFVTTSPIVIKLHKEAKTKIFPQKIAYYSKIENINDYLVDNKSKNRLIKRVGYSSLRAINLIRGSLKTNVDETSHQITEIHKFDHKIVEFSEKIEDNFMFLIKNSVEYLNWKYCDPRGGNYDVFVAEDDEKNIQGYCVSRINRFEPDKPKGYLVELQFIPGKLEIAANLLDHVLNKFTEENVPVANVWVLGNSELESLVQSRGFVNRNTQIYVYYNKEDRLDPQDLEQFETAPSDKLYYSYGYTDWI